MVGFDFVVLVLFWLPTRLSGATAFGLGIGNGTKEKIVLDSGLGLGLRRLWSWRIATWRLGDPLPNVEPVDEDEDQCGYSKSQANTEPGSRHHCDIQHEITSCHPLLEKLSLLA